LYIGILSLYEIIKTTLGPWGKKKLLFNLANEIDLSKNSQKILNVLKMNNPCSLLIQKFYCSVRYDKNLYLSQFIVLLGDIIKTSNYIDTKYHDLKNIVTGFRYACRFYIEMLNKLSLNIKCLKYTNNIMWWLLSSAKTFLNFKSRSVYNHHLIKLCLLCILNYNKSYELKLIKITKIKGGCVHESFFDRGILIKNTLGLQMSYILENPRIFISFTNSSKSSDLFRNRRNIAIQQHNIETYQVMDSYKIKKRCKTILSSGINFLITNQILNTDLLSIYRDGFVFTVDNLDGKSLNNMVQLSSFDLISSFRSIEKIRPDVKSNIKMIKLENSEFILIKNHRKQKNCTIVLRGINKNHLQTLKKDLLETFYLLFYCLGDSRFVLGGMCTDIKVMQNYLDY